MTPNRHELRDRAEEVAALCLLGVALVAVLALHLLLVLLTGLTVFVVHRALLARLERRWPSRRARPLALVLLLVLIVAIFAGIGLGLDEMGVGANNGSLVRLTDLLAESLDRVRASLPPWLAQRVPDSVEALRAAAVAWLRGHAGDLKNWGTETFRVAAHMLVGLVIGLLASASSHDAAAAPPPVFLAVWRHGLARLVRAFADMMGAQVRIAVINTAFTAAFLLVAVPLMGQHVPLSKTLVVLTFVASLVPVIGNLVSNSAVVLSALVASPTLAAVSLIFLVSVHKFEYFLNARLVGGRIEARTYELLAAMVLMEAVFGLRGVVAAPVYYAWLKGVLRDEGWV
jgi:predicted PurR-regulated permease PerM